MKKDGRKQEVAPSPIFTTDRRPCRSGTGYASKG